VVTWSDVCELGLTLPETEESTSYGNPALKVAGKTFVSLPGRVEGAIACRVDHDEKPLLLAARPDLYFETPHYEGWPWVLLRLDAVTRDELAERLEDSWSTLAPKRLLRG
jgi:hypothetical protein